MNIPFRFPDSLEKSLPQKSPVIVMPFITGITVFAIGVAGADKTELNEIASDPAKDFVFSVEKFDALDGISSRLQEKIFSLESQSNS